MRTTAIVEAAFVKAVEVWHVTDDGSGLYLGGGVYRGIEQFESISRKGRFAVGEGLPGWTCAAKVPVVFDDLRSTDFIRHQAARKDGLSAGVGLPIYDGDEITSVIVFLCGATEGSIGAFESWLPDMSRRELALGVGYYANLERFRRMTQFLRFPYGAGLPGEVWQTFMPRLMDRLADSTEFLRASGAGADGLDSGMSIPLVRGEDTLEAVFVFLSSARSPIARAFQIWSPALQGSGFELTDVVAPGLQNFERVASEVRYLPGQGLVGSVAAARRPALRTSFDDENPDLADAIAGAGLKWGLAWPVIAYRQVQAVCVLMN